MTYLLSAIGVFIVLWLVSGGSSGRLRVGRVVEDFEARLRPLQQEGPAWMASGKAHRERYRDGTETFDVRCAGVRTNTGEPRIPVGAHLDVMLGEAPVASVPLRRGHVRLTLSNRQGHQVPAVERGSVVSLRYQGAVLLQGVFERD